MKNRHRKHYVVDPKKVRVLQGLFDIGYDMYDTSDLSGVLIAEIEELEEEADHYEVPGRAQELADKMKRGVKFPPIVVREFKVVDGHHRIAASRLCGYKEIPVMVLGG